MHYSNHKHKISDVELQITMKVVNAIRQSRESTDCSVMIIIFCYPLVVVRRGADRKSERR